MSTSIVATNWETPTQHDTFPTLYVRTNNTDNEVKSSLVRFIGLNLPANAQVLKAELLLYFSGQSVNGGDMTVRMTTGMRASIRSFCILFRLERCQNPRRIEVGPTLKS